MTKIKTDYDNFKDPSFKVPTPNSAFLNTAYRVPMEGPTGILTYLDMIPGPPSKPGELEELRMSVFTMAVQAEKYKVDTLYTKTQISELSKFGIDGASLIMSQSYNEMCNGYESRLMEMYKESGKISKSSDRISKWKRLMFRLGFENVDYTENPIRTISLLSSSIALRSRRGPGNFVVVGKKTLAYLEDNPSFVYVNDGNNTDNFNSSYRHIGNIANIQVFVSEIDAWDTDEIIIGRKTKESTDIGTFICDYKIDVNEYVCPLDFENKLRLISRCTTVQTGTDPHANYHTTRLIIGAKPWYRKLLGI